MDRTYVVTGSASGIGAATAQYLREHGGRVIGVDLRGAEIVADLSNAEGRAKLVEDVKRLSGGTIDGIVANAGGGRPETMLSLNFFGTVATLEGLRPLIANSPAPRAVMVSSIASLSPIDPRIVEACLNMDEPGANAIAREAFDSGKAVLDFYAIAKHALNTWCRRVAATPPWAGEGIPINVVAPGLFDTPAARWVLDNPEQRAAMGRMIPMRGQFPGRPERMASILAWCVGEENSLMTGQILYVDGGFECLTRGERTW